MILTGAASRSWRGSPSEHAGGLVLLALYAPTSARGDGVGRPRAPGWLGPGVPSNDGAANNYSARGCV